MNNKPILKFLFLSLIIIASTFDIIGQNYICTWNSNRDFNFVDGNGTMPDRYKEDYKLKVRERNNQDSYRTFRKKAREIESLLRKKYYSIKYLINNRIVVRNIEAKVAIVDNAGKIVLEPEYYQVFLFINQQGWLLRKGRYWTLVDTNFQEIIEEKFKDVMIISDDHFMAKTEEGTDLYLCHSGKGIIKNFGEVCFQAGYVGNPTYIVIRDGQEKSLYNTDGDKIYDLVSRDRIRLVEKRFSDNDTPAFTINRNRKFGLVASDASYSIPIKYDRITDVSEGLDTDDIYFECKEGNKYTLYKYGDSILVSDFSIYNTFRNNLGPLRKPGEQKSHYLKYAVNSKYGLYNINTGFISEPKYDRLSQCTPSTLMVSKNRLYGVIDSLDNKILPVEFSRVFKNINSIIAKKDSTCAIYDLNGKILMPSEYEHIWALENDRFGNLIRGIFSKNGKRGFYDDTFKEVIPPIFDNADHFSSGLAAVKIDGKWGYIDKDAVLVIPAIFDKAAKFEEGIAIVRLNKRKISINKNGDCIKNCK